MKFRVTWEQAKCLVFSRKSLTTQSPNSTEQHPMGKIPMTVSVHGHQKLVEKIVLRFSVRLTDSHAPKPFGHAILLMSYRLDFGVPIAEALYEPHSAPLPMTYLLHEPRIFLQLIIDPSQSRSPRLLAIEPYQIPGRTNDKTLVLSGRTTDMCGLLMAP